MAGKKVVALFGSYERGKYSDFSLNVLLDRLVSLRPELAIERHVLPELFRELATEETLDHPDALFQQIGDSIMESDLLIIGSPLYNFTYSPYLHTLFHRLRNRFLTFDDSGNVTGRYMGGRRVFAVFTGRGSRLRWWALMRWLLVGQFSFMFRFWGGEVMGYCFLPGCHPGMLDRKRTEIEQTMTQVAHRLASKI